MENKNRINHVVLIADGNRRWAINNKLSIEDGYKAGAVSVERFIQCCIKEGIAHITIWLFSSANWGRPSDEISIVMKLINFYLTEYNLYRKYKMRIRHIGNKEKIKKLFPDLHETLCNIESESKIYKSINLNLAIDYSVTDEMVRIVKKSIEHNIKPEDASWESIKKFTDINEQPDVDLIIRTSGLQRLSGIFPIQTTFSELIFCDSKLPDLSIDDIMNSFNEFYRRKRTFGV